MCFSHDEIERETLITISRIKVVVCFSPLFRCINNISRASVSTDMDNVEFVLFSLLTVRMQIIIMSLELLIRDELVFKNIHVETISSRTCDWTFLEL